MSKAKKHYYDDNGILNYQFDRDLLAKLYQSVSHYTDNAIARSTVIEASHNIIYALITDIALSDKPERLFIGLSDSKIEEALKPALIDFYEKGYVIQEFILVANAMITEIQIALVMK
jgi:hypothetical protein